MANPDKIISTQLNTDFSLELALHVLLQEITQKKDSPPPNFVISPFSIHTLLLLIASGSKGQTLEQLLFLLRSKDHLTTSNLMTNLAVGDGGGPTLSFVNGIWIKEGFGLKPSFEKSVKEIYNAVAKEVDFPNKSTEVIEEINGWAEKETNGLIKNLLPRDCLKGNEDTTYVILANAVYFKAAWEDSFDISRTKAKQFHLLNNQTVQVPFMKAHSRYHVFGSFDGYKVLRMAYKEGKFAMYFFLSNEVHGLKNLVTKIKSCPGFFTRKFKLYREDVSELWIPRFKFSYEFKASNPMMELGLNLPFDEEKAEITEMVNGELPDRLYVSEIYHKAFIEVNEEGTEAAASSAAAMLMGCAMTEPESFVADHPFMFMIREEATNVVFFVGAVLNPLQQS